MKETVCSLKVGLRGAFLGAILHYGKRNKQLALFTAAGGGYFENFL
jgi:hypothetical protein